MAVRLWPAIHMIIPCNYIEGHFFAPDALSMKMFILIYSHNIYIIHRNHNECCTDSPTPDDAMFRQLALTYARNHPTMKFGHNCQEEFPDGITNGAHWYEVRSN